MNQPAITQHIFLAAHQAALAELSLEELRIYALSTICVSNQLVQAHIDRLPPGTPFSGVTELLIPKTFPGAEKLSKDVTRITAKVAQRVDEEFDRLSIQQN